ncbi:hypothetical protein L5515_002816 [Caenorhabditis briggsae]|uniref:Uncharacterized protein n=1 Tax=Caenorhabditis briggsae TaxID=6238 RepID=A0AAE9E6I3_CAEBR|nr:hypothetical protein L5515_002816 [Caenorhabditis briggsae]
MFFKTFLLNVLLITQINGLPNISDITNFFNNDVDVPKTRPDITDRIGLYSLYSHIPLPSELGQYTDYLVIYHFQNVSFAGKILEFDSMGWLNGKQSINHKLPYFIANPSFRTSHISKAWCDSTDFFHIGFRIYQTTREAGLPYQVKCATCHPIIEGLNNINYLFPERDFSQQLTKLAIGTRHLNNDKDYCSYMDCEQNPRVADFEQYLLENDLYFGTWTRWSGEHATTEADREVLVYPNGELAIHSRRTSGFTSMCGMELNGKVISSNIFVNGDVVGPDDSDEKIFTYQDYESLQVTVGAVKDEQLELFVLWDNWGCCSACCCPPAICGHDFQTSSDCENVFSSRTRTGHLSVRLLENRVKSNQQHLIELFKLLSIPPYTHRGIPLFSSLLQNSPAVKLAVDTIKQSLIPKFLTANKAASGYKFRSGMFVVSESCKSHVQKTDCLEWAKCHNVSLADANMESSETVSDSCQQVHFVDIRVGTDHMKVIVGQHQNLRIRVDSEVYDMNKIKPKWRINLRKPKKFDKSRPCLAQGIVQRADEILILNFVMWDLKVDLILGNEKVRITFASDRRSESDRVVKYTIFYWAIAIVAFFLLLIAAVIFMHREKTRRMERAIKSATTE